MGSNQQPLDSKSNVFPTELGRLICREGFKLLLYNAIYSYTVIRRVIAKSRDIVALGMYYIVLLKQKIYSLMKLEE